MLLPTLPHRLGRTVRREEDCQNQQHADNEARQVRDDLLGIT